MRARVCAGERREHVEASEQRSRSCPRPWAAEPTAGALAWVSRRAEKRPTGGLTGRGGKGPVRGQSSTAGQSAGRAGATSSSGHFKGPSGPAGYPAGMLRGPMGRSTRARQLPACCAGRRFARRQERRAPRLGDAGDTGMVRSAVPTRLPWRMSSIAGQHAAARGSCELRRASVPIAARALHRLGLLRCTEPTAGLTEAPSPPPVLLARHGRAACIGGRQSGPRREAAGVAARAPSG